MQPRPAGSDFDDWTGLHQLILTSFASMDGRIDPPSSAHRLSPEILRMRAAREHLWLAGSARLHGCVFFVPQKDALYISKLAIAPDAQRRGLARAFIACAQTLAQNLALPRLRLETRIELVENHVAFGAMGFVKTAQKTHPGFDRTTSITMEKPLTI